MPRFQAGLFFGARLLVKRTYYLAFLCALTVAFLVYLPGLTGSFLFDDYANLNKLGDFNGVRNIETFKRFVFSGIAGPTGRPISLLSFLANDTSWPSQPYLFKLTNLFLHLLTAAILFEICCRLAHIRSDQVETRHVGWIAGIAAASWLLHPFFVSTTLYVVQRMAILSALFVGLGLLIYIHGRCLLKAHPQKAYGWMSFAVIGCTVLAVFSKENGALLPILILTVEWSVLQNAKASLAPLNRVWKTLFLWLPLCSLLSYTVVGLATGKIADSYASRSFTLIGRVLTECRIIFDYLYQLFIPQMYTRGLFHRDILSSENLFSPPSTFAAVIGIIFLLGLGFYVRKRMPFITLAIIFFFAGHSLESSVFPLELYFEHRNYLPAFFLFLPLAQLAVSCPAKKSVSITMTVAWLAVLAFFTLQRASLWGHPNQLALLWANNNPISQRAQRNAAITLEGSDQPYLAMAVLRRAAKNMPDNLTIRLHVFVLTCIHARVNSVTLDQIKQALSGSKNPNGYATYKLLESLVEFGLAGTCNGVSREELVSILKAVASNPAAQKSHKTRYRLDHLLGIVYANQRRGDEAFEKFQGALLIEKEIDLGLVQAGVLATHEFFQHALLHLDTTEKLLPSEKNFSLKDMFRYSKDSAADIRYLREQITKEMRRRANITIRSEASISLK